MVERKLRAMDRNPLDTQVVVDLQEEGTENLSLQDEEGQFLHVVSPVLSTGRHEPISCVSPTHGIELPQSSQEETKKAELQQLLTEDLELAQEGSVTSIASDEELTRSSQEEAKEEELQQSLAIASELVQERPVASFVSSKVPTELEADYAKLQEQLHSTNKENSLLKQCLAEKEQKLSVLKGVMDQDKALLEEAYCENSILKQCLEKKEQELANLKNVIT